eukprot:6183975-Pleurochrysis_carterae.AAC.2
MADLGTQVCRCFALSHAKAPASAVLLGAARPELQALDRPAVAHTREAAGESENQQGDLQQRGSRRRGGGH